MNVLALDLGTRTGWALHEVISVRPEEPKWIARDGLSGMIDVEGPPARQGRIESGVQLFDLKRGESPGMRWLRFDRWLEELLPTMPPRIELIVYEAVLGRFARGQAQTFIASNFAGRIEAFCARYGIEHTPVPGSTLKKWATGKGNANKLEMHEAAHHWGWAGTGLKGEDEVDALCLLHYALAELVPGGSDVRRGRMGSRQTGVAVR